MKPSHSDIRYSDHTHGTYNLYQSVDSPISTPENNPLVVFVYGGAWQTGSKNYYHFIGHYFRQKNLSTIIPDYRKYPEVQFPVFIDDVADAIRHAISNSSEPYTSIILVGHSAGAHTAALLLTDNSYFKERDIDLPISHMIGLAGPYDLPFTDETTSIFATALSTPEKTNPVSLSQNKSFLKTFITLLHGTDDHRVLPLHSEIFHQTLRAQDNISRLTLLEGYSHSTIILNLLPGIALFSDVSREVSRALP